MVKKIDKEKMLKNSEDLSRAIRTKKVVTTMRYIMLINKIDDVLEKDISADYKCIIIKELIRRFREDYEENKVQP
jgi:hypothetical protein